MRWSDKVGVAWLAAWLAAVGAMALEVPLRYVSYGDPVAVPGDYRPSGGLGVMCTFRPQRGVKYPKTVSDAPAYGQLVLGDVTVAFLLDAKEAKDSFYDVLLIDFNGNSDLTDETPLSGASMGFPADSPYRQVQFNPVDTTMTVGGTETPYRIMAHAYCADFPALIKSVKKSSKDAERTAHLSLIIRSQCCYSGEFERNGRQYRIVLGDAGCNGLFSDLARASRVDESFPEFQAVGVSGDQVYMTEAGVPLTYNDRLPLGKFLVLGDDVFEVGVDIPGRKIELTPRTEGLVPVRLGMKADRLSLLAEDGGGVMIVDPSSDTVRVPPGEYRLGNYRAVRERGGVPWEVVAAGTRDSVAVAVREGQTEIPVLPFGTPFVPTAYVNTWDRDAFVKGLRQEVRVSCAAVGRGGEVITSLYMKTENGRKQTRPAAPSFVIVRADGEVATQGDFEYG